MCVCCFSSFFSLADLPLSQQEGNFFLSPFAPLSSMVEIGQQFKNRLGGTGNAIAHAEGPFAVPALGY